jgi:RNA polymerase sigma factor (TIGR02999 family)
MSTTLTADVGLAADELLPLVYEELRRLAAHNLAREAPGRTLNATALVHEAYLRLAGGRDDQRWESRRHFFGAAAEAMRRILIESARRRRAQKRGGQLHRLDMALVDPANPIDSEELLALDEALEELNTEDPLAAELVKLRYFTGLSLKEAAELLKIAPRTADRLWAYARARLYREIRPS